MNVLWRAGRLTQLVANKHLIAVFECRAAFEFPGNDLPIANAPQGKAEPMLLGRGRK